MNHPITPLASAQVGHDTISVELLEPNAMPPMVRIVWPDVPTIVNPKQFPDTAATVARLFAEAATTLASIKANRRL